MLQHSETEQSSDGTFERHRFDVFISYSRRDTAFARRLQRALGSYAPPRELPVPQRRLRVFRDESDFQGTEYDAALEEILGSAAKLIVICSPNSRLSRYVGGEIVRFAALRGNAHIVSVLVAGVPNNESPATDEEHAFHDELVRRLPVPLAADYRGWKERRDRIDRGRFESAWHKLLADVYSEYGVDRSGIEEREKLRQRRARRIWTALLSALTLVLASLTLWALVSRQEAIAQRNTAQSRFLAAQSMSGAHPYDLALLLAVTAHRTAPSFEAWEALFVGLQRQPALERFLHGADTPVRQIVVRGTGSCAAAWTDGGRTLVWDLAGGAHPLAVDGRALPDHSCRALAVASADGELDVRPLEQSHSRRWVTHLPAPVAAWAIDPGDTRLALAHTGGGLLLRDLKDGRVLAELTDPGYAVTYLRFSAEGKALAGIDEQGMMHLWDAGTLAPVPRPVRCGNGGDVFAISADLRWCAAGGPGRLVLTDLTGTPATEIDLGSPWVLSLDFSHDGRTLMAGVQGGDLQFWNVDHARRDGARATPTAWSEHRSDVTAAAYAADGSAIVSAARDRSLVLWHPEPRRRLVSEVARAGEGSSVSVDADATRIAMGTAAGDITVSAIGPDRTAAVPRTHLGKPVTAVALSRTGEVLAGSADGEVVRIGAPSPHRAFSTEHRSPIVRIRLSPDESRAAATAENGVVTIWDVATGTLQATFPGGRPRNARGGGITPGVDAAFDPRGGRIVSVHGDAQAFLWDLSAGPTRFSPFAFRPTSYFTSAAFGPDGRTIALGTGLYEGEVVLIDAADPGAAVTRLPGHDLQDVTGLAFSPDGRLLVSGGFDARVVIWDVAGRRRIGNVHRTGGSVTDVAYAANGAAVTAITDRGAVFRWDLDPRRWLVIACGIANRDLSAAERARFVDGAGSQTACP